MQFNFDDIHVPTEKLNMVVGQDLYKIKKQYRRKQLRKYAIGGMTAAAAILLITGIFASNPVLAAKLPLIGHIFQRVQDEQRYPGNFDQAAKPLADGIASTDQGITMTLSEVYCNSNALYIAAIIESDEPFPDGVKESNILYGDNIGYRMYLTNEQDYDFMVPPASYAEYEWPGEEYEWTFLDLKGEYVDDHTFIGAVRIDFSFYPVNMFDIPDTFHWKLTINNMKVPGADEPYFSQDGTWEFEADITVDQTPPRIVEVNESAPNGDIIKSVTMTDYEVLIDRSHDDSMVMEGYEDSDSLQSVLVDGSGRQIHDKAGTFSAAGYDLSKITVYYFPTPTEEDWMEIQRKLLDPAVQEHLTEYLEEISVHKIEIGLE